jgi:hypothetical protein
MAWSSTRQPGKTYSGGWTAGVPTGEPNVTANLGAFTDMISTGTAASR